MKLNIISIITILSSSLLLSACGSTVSTSSTTTPSQDQAQTQTQVTTDNSANLSPTPSLTDDQLLQEIDSGSSDNIDQQFTQLQSEIK